MTTIRLLLWILVFALVALVADELANAQNAGAGVPAATPMAATSFPPPHGRFLADVIATIKTALNHHSAEQTKAVQAIEEWTEQLKTYTHVDEFNRAIPEIKEASPIIRAAFHNRAKTLGFAFDKSAGLYKVPERQTAAVSE